MKLYGFFRSSATYRVRIALNLKGIRCERVSVNLMRHEASAPHYLAINPQGLVPVLEDGGQLISQSMAICEYLDERHPDPMLLPHDPVGRAHVRALALAVACEIHPLNNRRVQAYLAKNFSAGDEQLAAWNRNWMTAGFQAVEAMLARAQTTTRFCHGDSPTLADIFLIPQVYNAVRARVDLVPFPNIRRINEACMELDTFDAARPERQPDAA